MSERSLGIRVDSGSLECLSESDPHTSRCDMLLIGRIDPKTAEIVDTAEFEDTPLTDEMTPLPRDFNVPWKESSILRTEVCLASFGDCV